jgi:hypothetical protein
VLATPSRIQAKRKAAKDMVYVDESSDEIATNVSEVPTLHKDKGKKRRLTDGEDTDDPVTEVAAPKRRKVETKKGVYQLHIPVHVHVPRRRPTTPKQSDATSSDAMDVDWNDNVRDGTTEASEVQTFPRPVPKYKRGPRRSVTKPTIAIPSASSSYIRTRAQRAKSPIQGPPTPPSDTSPPPFSTSALLPASKQGAPPLDLAAFISAKITAAVAAQITGIREDIVTMSAKIERLAQNSGDARLAEIELREAALTAKEEEYERLRGKEIGPVEGPAALDMRYLEMEQELIATKERELLENASCTPLQIEQVVQDQVDISADQGAEEMELLVQEISAEESTNCDVSFRQGGLLEVVSQAESIVPFSVLEAAESDEVTFQEVLMTAAEVGTVGICLPTNQVDQGLDSDGDESDGRKTSAIAAINPRLEMTASAHGSVKATEDQATPGSLLDSPFVQGCAIDPRVSEPTDPPNSDEDAEAEIDDGAVESTALATPTNEL